MKILGLSGGTRNGHNDCVCKEALRGAQAQGADIEFVRLFDLNIQHCTGCRACINGMMMGKGNGCVLKDDFEWLLDKMLDADGIVFTMPIFEKCAPGIFHTIMDRFGPRLDRGNNLMAIEMAQKHGAPMPDTRIVKDKVVSYIGVGGSDWMTSVENDFGIQSLVPMWKIIDKHVFKWAATLIIEDRMQRAYEIGENLAKAAADMDNATYQSEPGVCPHCHSRMFYFDEEGQAICGICGIKGEIEKKDGVYAFSYDPEQEALAHDTLSGKAIHGQDINVNTEKEMKAVHTSEFQEKKAFYANFIEATKPQA